MPTLRRPIAAASTAALLSLVAACRGVPAPTATDDGTSVPAPAPDAADAGAPGHSADRVGRGATSPPEPLDPRTESLLIEYRIREIEDLLAADAIAPSSSDPSGIWRIDDFVFLALRTGEAAWTFTLLPTEPDLRMPPGNAPDWFRATSSAGARFTGRVQADVDVWLAAEGEIAAGGRAFHIACHEKDGSLAFDVVLDRGLGLEARGGLEAAVSWLTNRLRELEAKKSSSG